MNSTPIIAVVRAAGFQSYDKIKHSFVIHSDRTGVSLRPEAWEAVAARYPDFAATLPGAPKPKRKKENRKKNNNLRARLSDTMYKTVMRWMAEDGIKTQQEFIEACISCYGERYGKDWM